MEIGGLTFLHEWSGGTHGSPAVPEHHAAVCALRLHSVPQRLHLCLTVLLRDLLLVLGHWKGAAVSP